MYIANNHRITDVEIIKENKIKPAHTILVKAVQAVCLNTSLIKLIPDQNICLLTFILQVQSRKTRAKYLLVQVVYLSPTLGFVILNIVCLLKIADNIVCTHYSLPQDVQRPFALVCQNITLFTKESYGEGLFLYGGIYIGTDGMCPFFDTSNISMGHNFSVCCATIYSQFPKLFVIKIISTSAETY